MYKKVESKKELDIFHETKKVSWDSKQFEMEYAREGSDLYNFYMNGIPGGTFEFTPYGEQTREFIKELFVDSLSNDMKVMEVDSFSVLPEYRGRLGHEIVSFMIFYAMEKGYTHAIGIADPSVFKSFNQGYKIKTEQIGEAFWYKGDTVIPVLISVKEVYENLQRPEYAWFQTPIEWKVREVA